MKQSADKLLGQIYALLAEIGRTSDENGWRSQATSLLLKCHQFMAEYRDDGLGPIEVPRKVHAAWLAADLTSLKYALSNAASDIEVLLLPRMGASESEFYALLA